MQEKEGRLVKQLNPFLVLDVYPLRAACFRCSQ